MVGTPNAARADQSSVRVIIARLAASVPLAALALALVTVVLFLRAQSLTGPNNLADAEVLWAFNDFRDSVYYPAVAFIDGVNPYDPQAYRAAYPVKTFPLYSPLTLVIYAPLSILPIEAARWVYFWLTVGLYGVLAACLLRFAGRERGLAALLWLWALILASRPGHQNLLNGQTTAQVVLGVLLAVHYAGTRPVLAGLGILLASLKPTFGIPVVVLLLCQGHVRTVLASSAAIALGIGAVLAVLGLQHGGVDSLIDAVRANLGAHGEHPSTNLVTGYARIDLAMFASRWSGWIPGTGAELLLGAGLLLTAGWALRWRNRAGLEHGMSTWSSMLICFAVPLCIYHQSYDALMLCIPAAALALGAQRPWEAPLPGLRLFVLLCALAPLANYLATDSILRRLALEPGIWRYVTVINTSIIVAGFAACLLAMRSAPTGTGGDRQGDGG